jgi:hypothetical protein
MPTKYKKIQFKRNIRYWKVFCTPKDKKMHALLYNNIGRNVEYYQKIGRLFNCTPLSVLCQPQSLVTVNNIYIWYEFIKNQSMGFG